MPDVVLRFSAKTIRVAAFTTAAAVFITFALVLWFLGPLHRTLQFEIFAPDVESLQPGSIVKLDGITIGKVTDVDLTEDRDPNRAVKITVSIETRYGKLISSGSVARMATSGLLGDRYIEITSGIGTPLFPGSEIRADIPPPIQVDLRPIISALAQSLKQQTAK